MEVVIDKHNQAEFEMVKQLRFLIEDKKAINKQTKYLLEREMNCLNSDNEDIKKIKKILKMARINETKRNELCNLLYSILIYLAIHNLKLFILKLQDDKEIDDNLVGQVLIILLWHFPETEPYNTIRQGDYDKKIIPKIKEVIIDIITHDYYDDYIRKKNSN